VERSVGVKAVKTVQNKELANQRSEAKCGTTSYKNGDEEVIVVVVAVSICIYIYIYST
jgi:hypothetical protein